MDVAQLLDGNGNAVAAVGGAVVSIAVSVIVTCVVIVRLAPDHFACDHQPSKSRAVRWARNVGGVLLVALGVVLSFPGVPGQGVLTILLGIMCLDVAGKRRLELWLVRKPRVHEGMNRLRARYGKPPLVIPDEDGACDHVAGGGSARSPGEASARSSASPAPTPAGALAAAGAGAPARSRRDTTT